MMSVCGGSIGYRCSRCGGDYTGTDAGTCTCLSRKEDCAAEAKAQRAWTKFAELTIWKPKAVAV
jgi:hypothetical protein